MEAAERETVITWSDADEGMAHIFTAQRSMAQRLAKHPLAKLTNCSKVNGEWQGEEYDIPVWCISIRSRRRTATEAQREAGRRLASRNKAAVSV